MTQTTELPVVVEAADRLITAARSGVPCPPVRDLIGSTDLAVAYAVQNRLTAARIAGGAAVVGRKIGLTSPAVQAQMGVDQPDFGVLFDDMACAEDQEVPIGRLLQPKIEAEVAFVLVEDIAEGPFTSDRVRGAVGHAVAALEIVDSRVAGWDISLADTVADNASSGLYVLGARQVPLTEFEPVTTEMTMSRAGETVSTGNGAACLGDPLAALAWLAETASRFGEPLRAGQVILSGALGPMVPVTSGDVVRAELTGLGSVTATFSTSG